MVRLATASNPAFSVCDLEVRRGGRSYSVDTLTTLQDEHPDARFTFVAGADNLMDLPRWYQIERLLDLCEFAIVMRPGSWLDLGSLYHALPAARGRVATVAGPALDISATELRARLGRGAPVRYQLPDTVLEYIQDHGLYRPRA